MVLQGPSGSSRVLQGPPGSSRVLQGPPVSSRVLQVPPGFRLLFHDCSFISDQSILADSGFFLDFQYLGGVKFTDFGLFEDLECGPGRINFDFAVFKA